jgi:transcriptional regulator with XRE-family HTH domain
MTITITLPANPREIGPNLRALRLRLGFTQESLVKAGVGSQSTLSALENGIKMPLFHTVIDYLTAIGCVLAVTREDGEAFPSPSPRRRVVAEPAPAEPEPAPLIHGKTSTGRCLGCFTVHEGLCS